MDKRYKPLLIILTLVVLFAGPLWLAWHLYVKNAGPYLTVNHGQFIKPLLSLEELPLYLAKDNTTFDAKNLRKKWQILYVTSLPCNALCQENLRKMRQVRLALGKDSERVGRVLVTPKNTDSKTLDARLTNEYTGTLHLTVDKVLLIKFFIHTPLHEIILNKGTFYLVDPLGYVMMVYPSDVEHKSLYEDLTRLLNISQVG